VGGIEMNNETIILKKFGKKLKLARSNSNLTQEKLAEKTSLSARYISQLERGLAFGSATTLTSICNALNIDPDFLFSDSLTSSDTNNNIDENFLDSYIKLDSKNKKIVNTISKELLKLQRDEKKNLK
jgi:transcriptional regulator with XRE-family HTH domain